MIVYPRGRYGLRTIQPQPRMYGLIDNGLLMSAILGEKPRGSLIPSEPRCAHTSEKDFGINNTHCFDVPIESSERK